MVSDHLSEAFDLVEVRGVLSGGFAVRGPWVSRTAMDTPLKFMAMVCGRARLSTDGIDGPIELEPGDVVILNNRSWLELRGGTGDGPIREITPTDPADRFIGANCGTDDVLFGGRVDLNPAGQALLLQALPPVGHVRGSAATAANLRGTLHRLLDEVTSDRIGSAFAIRQYGQLLLLEVLRAYVGQAELPPGWLRVLTDERLRPVVTAMHTEPGKPWGLEELARAAAMSRTSFAERFRAVAGMPPLAYLNRWRMLLAQRALRDGDVRVGSLAAELGYASESAFSTAFKREVGVSPLRYRHRVRDELPGRAESLPN
ncbi:AraC family transcriptional regulator [Kibdelosporangium persicum]|uniref:Exoenzyme S synthesis regulatory protein ExsA n=1 Tax=Kibdelosporangium persicum TaxID=2698649 RepID=A0ABX2FHT4_9PSEU|nr:AraC family transcriptional regulator [Kibdelosporangium persicum]NRN70788.1 Exoenzyme S synthesis regulatory protein ExsA [Kibdelosporangium persicum]